MGSTDWGEELYCVFDKYYRGRRVDKSDRKTLDYIYQASYIDYSYSDGALFAEASDIGRMFRPHPLRRFMRRVR